MPNFQITGLRRLYTNQPGCWLTFHWKKEWLVVAAGTHRLGPEFEAHDGADSGQTDFFSSWYSSSRLMSQISALSVFPEIMHSAAALAVSIE